MKDKEKLFPIQQGNPIPWSMAEQAYLTYSRLFGIDQSLQRLAERGGFGVQEFACLFAGHSPSHCQDRDKCRDAVAPVTRKLYNYRTSESNIQQILGKALHYPWYKDDQKNFPGATEENGVCVGDHVAESLAMEAAKRIRDLESAVILIAPWLSASMDARCCKEYLQACNAVLEVASVIDEANPEPTKEQKLEIEKVKEWSAEKSL